MCKLKVISQEWLTQCTAIPDRHTGRQTDEHHTVHFSADLSLRLDCQGAQYSVHPDTKAWPPTRSCLFPFPPGREEGCKLGEELNANNDK